MKSKILLLTTMLASASFAFAQTTGSQKVYYNDVTFEILEGEANNKITTPGTVAERTPREIANQYGKTISVEITRYKNIYNQRRQINVKAVSIDTENVKAGQILSWESSALVPEEVQIENYDTNIGQFGVDFEDNPNNKYIVYTDDPDYLKYKEICEKASQGTINPVKLFLGTDIPEEQAKYDASGVRINKSLYYFRETLLYNVTDENGNPIYDEDGDQVQRREYKFTPITRTTGGITEQTTMFNCMDVYTPTEISDALAWNVTTSGKVGIVSGVVNNARITEAVARNERNFDFANALVLGEININVPANKLAYFPEGTKATGTNIVIDLNCNNYLTKDNGEEIYVKEGFTAKRATYERKFTPNTYGTIVLPFAASTDQNDPFFEKLAQLTGYDPSTDVLTFTNTYESIVANRPYLYRLQDEAPESIKAINVNVGTTPSKVASGTYNGATMYGTFQKLSYAQIQGKFGISADGGIVNAKEGASLKPGRAYLDLPPFPANSAKTFTIELVDEDGSYELIEVTPSETTAIEGTIADAKVVSTQYIAIDGTVSTTPHKGMNIVKKTLEDGTIQTSKVAF